VGQWPPEPLLAGDPLLGPANTAEQRESVSCAVLTLMERLSPNERAVYVLREAFDYPHREILWAQYDDEPPARLHMLSELGKRGFICHLWPNSPVSPRYLRYGAD
jgi:hypothetical protein